MVQETEDDERLQRFHRALAEGVELYNSGRFFECHEVLEAVWLEEKGDDKDFLQGIIKIAAAFHHFRKGTYRGMLDLLEAGRETLWRFRPRHHGVDLEGFLHAIEAWIPVAKALLDGQKPEIPANIPAITYRPHRDQ